MVKAQLDIVEKIRGSLHLRGERAKAETQKSSPCLEKKGQHFEARAFGNSIYNEEGLWN